MCYIRAPLCGARCGLGDFDRTAQCSDDVLRGEKPCAGFTEVREVEIGSWCLSCRSQVDLIVNHTRKSSAEASQQVIDENIEKKEREAERQRHREEEERRRYRQELGNIHDRMVENNPYPSRQLRNRRT